MAKATTKPSVKPNPSVNEVLNQVISEIDRGASYPLTNDSVSRLKKALKPAFERRLKLQGSWALEGLNVLAASYHTGVIASSIASIHKSTELSWDHTYAALKVVAAECEIGFGEGRWCQPQPQG